MNRTKELAYWINERESMRIRKEDSEDSPMLPYSQDPAMANVRYCNVHREDDKVTRWIAKHWRNPNATSPLLTLGMVAARMINWPETLERIAFPATVDMSLLTDRWNFMTWAADSKATISWAQAKGTKTWTSAYTISTCGRNMRKEDYVFDHVLYQVSVGDWRYEDKSLEEAFKMLTRVDGLGSFLAGQVIADLKNTPGHPLSRAPDFKVWAAPGPGSIRGLEAYFEGRYHGRKVTPALFSVAINECYHEVIPFIFPYVGEIHMQDFQNCLCEFSKYMRVKEGDGRVRNSYSPTAR